MLNEIKTHIMKIKALVVFAMAFYMMSCSSIGRSTTDNYTITVSGQKDNSEVEKTLDLSNFSGIESDVAVDIYYTPGAKYNVKVRAKQEVLDKINISENGSVLMLKRKKGEGYANSNVVCKMVNGVTFYSGNTTQKKVTLYVTAPEINVLENSGGDMQFHTKVFNSDGLRISNNGAFKLNAESLKCTDGDGLDIVNLGSLTIEVPTVDATWLSLDNTGSMLFNSSDITGSLKMKNAGQLTFSGHVKGTTVELNNSGMCQVNSTFDLTDSYTCKTSGLSNNDGDVTARTISIFNSGQEQRKGTLKADRLTIDVDGNSQYAMSFIGDDAKLYCSGGGNFNFALNCQSIDLNSDGYINVSLSGTADKTSFEGSGISHLNTSKLNKF